MGVGQLVTVLFTDIESSTDRWEDDAEQMAAALIAHDRALDRAIERNGGTRFKHTGDGVCAVFPTPGSAVLAALDAQRALELPVRMGVHTGEVMARDGDFYGPTLNRCARIMDAGHGGQVLVSAATASLLDGVELVDLGAFALKGIERSERIFQLGSETFPSLRARQSSNLPTATSSLIGRDALVASVAEAAGDHRLVTLTGAGGVGKTRLALAAAHRVETDFDAAFFVGLQEIDDDDEVLDAIGLALDLNTPTLGSLATALSQRRTLLVLDNCEHVLDAVADVIEHVMSHADGCHVLTTSREGLAVDGELIIPVPTLGADDDGPAVALFVERATARHHGFHPDADALAAITSICRRLDGLPLAIELAAARVGALPPADLLQHLDERFRVLTGSRRRRGRDRQRTLEETIGWSYDLLDGEDQDAFGRLAVFAGSFDLAAAAAVLGGDELDALDRLEALVDRSLLATDDVVSGRRFRYLETIRAYAEQRLHDAGASEDVLEALHAHLVAAMPELIERFRYHMRIEAERLERETPNLRRAFDWAVEREDARAATALIRPLLSLLGLVVWPIHGWAEEALGLPDVAGSDDEPVLLLLQANDRHRENRFREIRDIAQRVLQHDRAPRPLPDETAFALLYVLSLVGEYDRVRELLAERASAGTRTWVDVVLDVNLARREEDFLPQLCAELGPAGEFGTAIASQYLAFCLAGSGPTREFREAQRQALDLFVEASGWWFIVLQLGMSVELSVGNLGVALELADFDLEHAYRIADRAALILPLLGYAMALRSLGEIETAAIVRGRLPRRMTVMMERELVDLDAWLAEQLDESAREELAARGAAMEPRDLRDLARSVVDPHLASGE